MDGVNIPVGRKVYRMVQSNVSNAETEAIAIGVIDHLKRQQIDRFFEKKGNSI